MSVRRGKLLGPLQASKYLDREGKVYRLQSLEIRGSNYLDCPNQKLDAATCSAEMKNLIDLLASQKIKNHWSELIQVVSKINCLIHHQRKKGMLRSTVWIKKSAR